MNMLATIVPKSDQINADDLIGRSMTITVNEVRFSGGQEQPVSMYFDGSDKAYRPCKSMCRVLVAAWGPDAKQYVGRSMTLYRDPSVKWGGLEVGGIRISHMTDIDGPMTMALTATKGSRKPYTVKPLAKAPAADPARDQAEQWLSQHLANVLVAESEGELTPIAEKAAKMLARRPELAQRAADAADARRAAWSSGKATSDHGESFSDSGDADGERITDEVVNKFGGGE